MLTFACRRASKLREEGRAHFSPLGLGIGREVSGRQDVELPEGLTFRSRLHIIF